MWCKVNENEISSASNYQLVKGLTRQHWGFWNAMLLEKHEDLFQRSCHKWNSAGQSQLGKKVTTNGEELQTEILRSHLMPHLTRKRCHAGHCARPQEMGRSTERMVRWPCDNTGLDPKGRGPIGISKIIYEVAHARVLGTALWLIDWLIDWLMSY